MRNFLSLILLCMLTTTVFGQTITVDMPEASKGTYVPASVDIGALSFPAGSVIELYEKIGGKTVPVPYQLEERDNETVLHFLIPPREKHVAKRTFEIRTSNALLKNELVVATRENGALTIHAGDKNLLRYQYDMVYPPKGIDSAYGRNAFIHPLWSPHGQVLTRIQPPDHYHHYGIWNPWTHVLYKKDTVDFWNIGSKKGTVRFAGFEYVLQGPMLSGFDAKHQHVVFKKDGEEEVALTEMQSVRVYRPDPQNDYYIVDFIIRLACATDNPVRLLEYRYGGFGWRTTEKWDNKNSEVITSSGKTRKDADGSKATWCIVQGALDSDYGGVVMMSYPTNFNHPEPLRIWPENQYDRGDMFANFSPTKDKDWSIEPGEIYIMNYRLLVFNGKFTAEKAEAAWRNYAKAPTVNMIIQR